MVEIVFIIILIGSLTGMAVIIFRKIPVLVNLDNKPSQVGLINEVGGLILNLTSKIKKRHPLKNFCYETFLQKIISRIKIFNLKIENKTTDWLKTLREKSVKKKNNNKDDNYWDEVKKSIKDR